jgi:transcriptional regulator with XRE-family HTH domain
MNRLKQFANVLKEARIKSGLTQSEVAEALGYDTAQFISNWERGISYPPIKTLKTLSKLYKISPDVLFDHILQFSIAQMEENLRKEYSRAKKKS